MIVIYISNGRSFARPRRNPLHPSSSRITAFAIRYALHCAHLCAPGRRAGGSGSPAPRPLWDDAEGLTCTESPQHIGRKGERWTNWYIPHAVRSLNSLGLPYVSDTRIVLTPDGLKKRWKSRRWRSGKCKNFVFTSLTRHRVHTRYLVDLGRHAYAHQGDLQCLQRRTWRLHASIYREGFSEPIPVVTAGSGKGMAAMQ